MGNIVELSLTSCVIVEEDSLLTIVDERSDRLPAFAPGVSFAIRQVAIGINIVEFTLSCALVVEKNLTHAIYKGNNCVPGATPARLHGRTLHVSMAIQFVVFATGFRRAVEEDASREGYDLLPRTSPSLMRDTSGKSTIITLVELAFTCIAIVV